MLDVRTQVFMGAELLASVSPGNFCILVVSKDPTDTEFLVI